MTLYLKKTIQLLFLFICFILMCRFTGGHAMLGIIVVGSYAAIANKRGWAMFYFLMIPLLTSVNYLIMPHSSAFNIYCRFGTVVMAAFLFIASSRSKGRKKIPLLGLLAYLAAEFLSSLQGVYPLISCLKIINFIAFLIGIYLGTANLQDRSEDVLLLRATFMAFSIFLVIGSLMTLAVPAVAYTTSVQTFIMSGDVAGANEVLRSSKDAMTLFTGVTWHSQALAPMLTLVNGWLLCDMLLIEKRITKLHGVMLAIIPVLLFMTRSRAGLLAYIVSMVMVTFYVMPRSQIPYSVRQKVMGAMGAFIVLLVIGAGISEAKNHTLSRWLRKSNDVEKDSRSFSEALTSSRMGLVEGLMYDFKSSPLLGIGFQVTRDMKNRDWGKSLFSAPVEKGVLPLVVLSESGIVGTVIFVMFLMHFWNCCTRDHNIVLLALFVVMLATNMAEATFFSPSGAGGILWIIAVVGGFMIDVTVKEKRAFSEIFR